VPDSGRTHESDPLSAPLFRDDRQTDIARLVYWISAVLFVAALVFALVVFTLAASRGWAMTMVSLIIWAIAASAIVLVRSGHSVGAARVIVIGVLLISTSFTFVTGGLSSPAIIGPLFAIALAGILLGAREAIATAVIVALIAAGMAWAESALGLVFPAPFATPWLRAGFIASYAVAVAVVQIVTFRSLMTAVEVSRRATERLTMAGKVYDTTSEGIVVTTPDGTIVDVNDAYLRIHGYKRADVIGHNPRIMKSGKHPPEFFKEMWDTLLATGHWQGEIWDRRADGSLVAKWLSLVTVEDDDGRTTHYVGVFSDITAVKQGQEDLEWLAAHDPLTGLPNRMLLNDRLLTAVTQSHRHGTSLALLSFDIDHFKDVNDTLGHPAGDGLLIEIAKRCNAVVRESDTFGRSGGDEFEIVVSGFSDVEDLDLLARRLLSAIADPITLDDQEVRVTASIGIAVYPESGDNAAELTRHADVAMYRAKSLGRNRYQFYSEELQAELQHRVQFETRLRAAIKEDRLFMVYQPQVDLKNGQIIGVESLVRWRDVDGSTIMPGEFVPLAESSDLILEIGAVALRHACADLRTVRDAGHRLTMAINVSARELMDQDVATIVSERVKAAGIGFDDIEIEVTESAIIARTDVAAAQIRRLQDLGVVVSIDDFGTGYASMSYVMDFHPAKLKIDRSFVTGLPGDSSAVAIVNATIALAEGIGAKVLAEGPDTEAQVRFLQEQGCDIGQGFYFSEGIPLEELLELLATGPLSLPA